MIILRLGLGWADDPGCPAFYTIVPEAVLLPGDVDACGAPTGKFLIPQPAGIAEHHLGGPSITPVRGEGALAGGTMAGVMGEVDGDASAQVVEDPVGDQVRGRGGRRVVGSDLAE